ncbi:MAG: hypothetical protein JEZ06_19525 [Anaerolineaceae bacterium]|nr:hypothetical protein [Anaerolineaceae bacterium]
MLKKWFVNGGSLLFLFFLISCTSPQQVEGTSIWIDSPLDQVVILPDQMILIKGHISSATGIEMVELRVDGVVINNIHDPVMENNLGAFAANWSFPEEGSYLIEVVAYGSDGTISNPDHIQLHVLRNRASETVQQASATLTGTEQIPSETQAEITLSPTASLTTTQTPRPPTPTKTIAKPTETPTDDSPPPIPDWIEPAADLPCSSNVILEWQAVSDPSGISVYILELQKSFNNSDWQELIPIQEVPGNQTTFPVVGECGIYYRARVAVRDGAGNSSAFSEWAFFAILIE